ncbi:MAG: single-stranded DNA-binding protein [Nocardioides sp.]
MNETLITLQGWVGGNVTARDAGGVPVATFRVASTPRRFNRRTDQWGDGETQWHTVNVWRALAQHCERSLRRGDPVFVHGRLNATTWTNAAGVEVSGFEVDAYVVGHDLTRGCTAFSKAAPAVAAAPTPTPEAEQPAPAEASRPSPEESAA